MTERYDNLNDTYEQFAAHENDIANDVRMDFMLKVSDFFGAQTDLFQHMTAVMEGEGASEEEAFDRVSVSFKVTAETFADAVLAADGESDGAQLAAKLDVQFSRQLREVVEGHGGHQIVPVQSERICAERYESILSQYDADDDNLATMDFDVAGDPAVFTGLAAEFYDDYHGYVAGLLDDAQPNKNDIEREQFASEADRRTDIKEHVLDVAKVALGAAIAGAALRLFRK